MKIILRQDYQKLGKIGDVVEVKDGFARNFLIPRNIGHQATAGNIRALDEEKKQVALRQGKDTARARKLAGEIEKASITLKMKVGEDERLFGAVTSQMIADALAEKGFTIDKRSIETDEQIKALGIYSVTVKLHPEVETKVKVWVVRE
jgi:large subunit ribosomal protein L9